MKATWDRLEKNWMQFTVEVEAEQFAQAVNQAYRKLVRQSRIPGFRPGKAPRFIFERHYGKDTLIKEAVDALLPEAYATAVRQGNVDPIDQPDIDLEAVEEGKPLVFKGKVQVVPEVKLGRLNGFDIAPNPAEVTPEQVEDQLRRLQERMAQLVPDEGGEVKTGSFASIDFEGFVDGAPLEGGAGKDHFLEIGSGRFIPGFEEQLVGARPGDEREIKVTFPADYHAEHLQGKEASFKVTVKDVKRKEVPELDDAFSASVSRFQTLQELRSDIENKLKESALAQAERDFRNRVLEAVAQEAEVELPEVLVHRRIHALIEDFSHTLQHQGLSLEAYMEATGKDHEAFHKEFDETARKQVKADLVLDAVAREAGLSAAEAEIDAQFDLMQKQDTRQSDEWAKLRRNPEYRERVMDSLLKQKALAHLVSLNMPADAATTPEASQE